MKANSKTFKIVTYISIVCLILSLFFLGGYIGKALTYTSLGISFSRTFDWKNSSRKQRIVTIILVFISFIMLVLSSIAHRSIQRSTR